jgi:transcriptional regulator with XRE-family HTH domain
MGQSAKEVGPATSYIAGELRAQRARLGWTFDDLARQSGIPRASAANALSGKRSIDAETLIDLCSSMGIDPRGLISEAAAHINRRTS